MPASEKSPQRKRNWWVLAPFLAIILGLNFLYDYYHPIGFVFDIVILLVIAGRWASGNNPN